MNISAIKAMLEADPSIAKDVAGFVERMNAKNHQQVVTAAVIVQQAVTQTVSIADMNGGECTARDVEDALLCIATEPLIAAIDQHYDNIVSAIQAGQIKSVQDVKDVIAAIPVPVTP